MLFHILLNIPLKWSCCRQPYYPDNLDSFGLEIHCALPARRWQKRSDFLAKPQKTHFQKTALWEQIVLALINSCAMLKQ